MPEIAEVARIVHFLRKSLVGKTLATVTAVDDANVYGKVGTSGAEFEKSLTGKKVIDAGQQGKYFWLIMSSPPHPVFHFGMTGWFHIRGEHTMKYPRKAADDPDEWPPRFWKFTLETKESPKVEAAFTDARRFARIRLLDCKAEDIRNTTPLKENGPDPVIDKDKFTFEWFEKKMRSKHVPTKALLLDQANISGIGNWVGDEVLYHAKLHPEQYSDTFSTEQLKQLHSSILYVCQTAIDALADSSKFPDEWLFNHRWGKGKKDAPTTLPNGAKITFMTVGGRTSCVVPSVQKKTGAVAGDVKKEDQSDDLKTTKKGPAKKRKAEADVDAVKGEEEHVAKLTNGRAKKSKPVKKEEDVDESEKHVKAKPENKGAKAQAAADIKSEDAPAPSTGRRRSGRISKG